MYSTVILCQCNVLFSKGFFNIGLNIPKILFIRQIPYGLLLRKRMHACKLATIATFMLNFLCYIWVCGNLIFCQCNVLFFKGFSMQLSVEIYLKVTKNKTIAVRPNYFTQTRKYTIATFMTD